MGLINIALIILAGMTVLFAGYLYMTNQLGKNARVLRVVRWVILFITGFLIGMNFGIVLFYIALAFSIVLTTVVTVTLLMGATLLVWSPAALLTYFASKKLPEDQRHWYLTSKLYYVIGIAFILSTQFVAIPIAGPITNFMAQLTAPPALYLYNFFDLHIQWIINLGGL